jgi:hypothetical protein
MPIDSPLAVGLETGALVLHEAGARTDTGDHPTRQELLAAAASIRSHGDRPPPATLAPAVNQLRNLLGGDGPAIAPTPRDTARRACQLLAELGAAGPEPSSPRWADEAATG